MSSMALKGCFVKLGLLVALTGCQLPVQLDQAATQLAAPTLQVCTDQCMQCSADTGDHECSVKKMVRPALLVMP